MTRSKRNNSEFYALVHRSEELLASIRAKRESDLADLDELRRLNDAVSQVANEMEAMLLQGSMS